MKSPNFFCIGSQKSGTTLLYELLKDMDDIYLPSIKEIHFFDEPSRYKKGLNWYREKYFRHTLTKSVIGEITPSYLFLEDVPKRIYDSLGSNLKFIVILRNPIQRAYSHYTMRYKKGEEDHSFADALILETMRIQQNLEYKKKYSYLERGLYSKQINNYLKYFDKKQFIFIEFDDFTNNQNRVIKDICNFLEVEKNITIENKKIHSSSLLLSEKIKFSILNKNYNIFNILKKTGYPNMNDDIKEILKEYYKNDIVNLEKIIDKDLSKWLQ